MVATDATYVKPYTTDTIVIASGETVDALLVADAPPGRYYMVAQAMQSPEPFLQIPTTGITFYADGCRWLRPVGIEYVGTLLSNRRHTKAIGIGTHADGVSWAVGID